MTDAGSERRVRTGRGDCPSPHGAGNKAGRALWTCVWIGLFRPSPPPLEAWRRCLLRRFGARIGRGARVLPSVRVWAPWNLDVGEDACLGHRVDCYCVAPVRLGACATVSQDAVLCTATHDLEDPRMRLVARPIVVADQAWVAAGAFLLPGVTVGQGAVCGARAVVTRDVAPWTVVAGNPARFIRERRIRSP